MSEDQYGQGAALLFEEKIFEALEVFSAILEKSAGDRIALRERAFCLLRLERFEEAATTIRQLRQLYEGDSKGIFMEIKLIILSQDDGSEKTVKLQRFAWVLDGESHPNQEGEEIDSVAWMLLVQGILAHLMVDDLKESVRLCEQSYKMMGEKEKFFVATEIGNLFYDFYLIEEASQLEAQLGCTRESCLETALKWFLTASSDNKNSGQGLLVSAQIYFNNGDYDMSNNFCQQALELSSTRQMALIQQSFIALKQTNSVYKSMEIFKEAYLLSNQNVAFEDSDFAVYAAGNLSKRGFMSEAIQVLEKCLEINPNSSNLYLQLGHVYFLVGDQRDMEKSIKYYEKCYEVDENFKDPMPAIAVGSHYLEQVSMIQEAEDGLDRENNDNSSEQNKNEKEVQDLCLKALGQFKRAIRIDENKCRKVYKSIANCYQLLGKNPQAVEYYEKELKNDEDDLETLSELAYLLKDMNNKKRAVGMIERVLLLDQHDADMYEILCELLDNEAERIVMVLKRVFERDMNRLDNIAQLIARTYVTFDKRQHFKQPEKWIATAKRINPENPEIIYVEGLLNADKDQSLESLECFKKYLQINPEHEESCENMLRVIRDFLDELSSKDVREMVDFLRQIDEEWLEEELDRDQNCKIKMSLLDEEQKSNKNPSFCINQLRDGEDEFEKYSQNQVDDKNNDNSSITKNGQKTETPTKKGTNQQEN